ncbi:MAG TPA: clostripain-related cysteine peptidase, partial [Muribaculaceae bacterium]|nr:clostripain-related cysteine peptidase [Muribaculaceae bacterium]
MKLSTRIIKSIQDLKRLAGIAATIAVAVATVSCGSSKDEPEGPTNEHTVIVYMAACNSLGSGGYDRQDLIEMQEAVANNTLHGQVLVYRGDIDGNAKLYRMTAEGPKPLRDYASDGLSSVHSERMINVLKDARTLAPARSYGLVLWSHGNGWLQTGIEDNNNEFQPTAWGEDRGRVMNI